ncbi:WXG100 family type VII secretion target [Tomitella biformata]|uniref:WXG100 family type VII secretion target n=1 Tax=Tomitella biformata TaxID=630403 RepID=UPI000464E72B|nr:WXG100 family type VII secretion target [Tomitella biformata]
MSSPDGIKYNFGGISQVVGEINSHVGTFEAQKDQLAVSVKELLAVWQSTAADAYHGSQTKFDQAYVELNQVLQLIGSKVQDGSDRMFATNARAAASWG